MDIKTILISYLITNAICAGVIWALYSQNRKHFNGLELWLTAYLMQFAGLVLVITQNYLPDLISSVMGSAFFIGGMALLYVGLERFFGKHSNQTHNYILFALFVVVHAYFLVVRPNISARSITLSLTLLVICIQVIWLIFCRSDVKLRPIVRSTGLVFAAHGLVSLIHICVNLVRVLRGNVFQPDGFENIVLIAYQMLFILLTFNLFLMVNRRLLMEVEEDASERKRTADALKQSEKLYRQMFFEHSAIKLLVDPSTGAIVQANSAAAQFYGYAVEELQAMNIAQINVLSRVSIAEAMMQALLRKTNYFVFQHRLASGKIRDVEVHSAPINVGGRELLYSIIHDVTERKQAESQREAALEKLRESEERLRLAVSAGHTGIWDRNFITGLLNWSVECKAMFGFPPETEMNDELFMNAIHPDDRLPTDMAIREAQAKRTNFNTEYRVIWPDGTLHWIAASGQWYYDEAGQAVRMAGVTLDITDQKLMREALEERTRFTNKLLESTALSTWISDAHGTAIQANPACYQFFGTTEAEVIGKYNIFEDNVAAQQGAMPLIRHAYETGEPVTFFLDYDFGAVDHVKSKNATHKFIKVMLTPILDTQGKVSHVVSQSIDLTEIKQSQEALRASEERFRQLIISAPDVVFVVDEEGKITFANMEATNLLGYTPDEFIGMAVEKLMPQNIRENHIANRTKYMRDPHTRLMGAQLNLLATHKDGNEIPVDIKISPVNIDGKTHIVAFMRDITMRKQAGEKLRESEEKYRLIVETAHEGIWVLDTDGKTSYVNTRMAEMLGYKIEEMIGHSLFEFMDDDARKEAEQMLERRRKGVAEQHEFRFRRKDGSPIWALLSTNAIIDSDGKFIGALGMVTDVTERKQAEEKLIKAKEEAEEGEARFRKSLEFSPTPIALADYTGKMIFLNQNFIDTYGYTLQDIPTIDQWMLQAYPDTEYRNSYLQLWEQDSDYAIKNNTATPLRECLVTCKSGEVKTVAILAFFEKDLIIGHFLDISERKQAEEALRLEQAFVNNALDNQQDTFFLFDFTSGKALRWNRAFREISGYSDEEIAALPAPISYYSADDLTRENAVIQRVMQGEPASIVMNLICKDGHKIATEYQAAPLKDVNGEYRYIIAIGRDITERVRIESDLRTSNETLQTQFKEINMLKETLQEQAIRDPLTELHNRRYLNETLEHEVARAKRENYPIGIMLIDIDRFKKFNDTYGHSTGDEILKSLSRLLVDSVRQGDIACRYGGEEFLVIMIGAHETDVERRAEKIRHDFNELQIRFENREISATVSIGVAYYPRHGTEIQQVIENADAAMYQAKQEGRNKVHIWGEM